MDHWIGIDFSGDFQKWSPTRRDSNVWIAELYGDGRRDELRDLRRVQELPGREPPFERLARFLQGSFSAAAIDAPFSIPVPFVETHAALLAKVAACVPADRSFMKGPDFVAAVIAGKAPPTTKKPLRATEERWQERRVNVRSTLWASARGGAPMTAACLTLLHKVNRPIWPFERSEHSTLAEAFPAAQLWQWNLPHQGYGKRSEGASRKVIVEYLAERVELGAFKAAMLDCADALDAVVCTFAAKAVTKGALCDTPGPKADTEGWIAVHR